MYNLCVHRIPYPTYFGGVTAFTVEQFKKINGHSNLFWGWGGEDDDAYNRYDFYNRFLILYFNNIVNFFFDLW